MVTITEYPQIICNALSHYEHIKSSYGDIRKNLIHDPIKNSFVLMTVGWLNGRRVHSCSAHLQIRNGKIWIEEDNTEEGVATDLIEAGVPSKDIVLGFQPLMLRENTEFAIG